MPDFSKPIIETISASGLNPAQCVVLGGSALALHGIRPGRDVDVLAHPELFSGLRQSGTLPNGQELAVRPDGLEGVRLSAARPKDPGQLGIDIVGIHGFMNAFHFERYKSRTDQLSYIGGVLHFANLELLRDTKRYSLRPKDWMDLRRIRRRMAAESV